MHSTRIHKVIDIEINFIRRIGIWHGQEDIPTISQLSWKFFVSVYYWFLAISLLMGAILRESLDDRIFLAEAFLISTVMATKIYMLVWKQKQIMGLLNRICVFSIRSDEEFTFFNIKVERFIKFVVVYIGATILAILGASAFPFIGNTKTLIIDIAFPLDWKNSEFGFWMANIFFVTENVLTFVTVLFSVIIWYLLLHCTLRYQILGAEIRKMGQIMSKAKISQKEQQAIFYQDLVTSIEAHLHLKGLIDELESFVSTLFLLQFATSGSCICGSIYYLAFDISANTLERVIHVYVFSYNIAELFMITYFGNEIMLSSSRLTYRLFESEWIDQPQSTKKRIIIFCEYLKRSHEILIGKLYPLILETFTRIINSAYNLFNILKNIEH